MTEIQILKSRLENTTDEREKEKIRKEINKKIKRIKNRRKLLKENKNA